MQSRSKRGDEVNNNNQRYARILAGQYKGNVGEGPRKPYKYRSGGVVAMDAVAHRALHAAARPTP